MTAGRSGPRTSVEFLMWDNRCLKATHTEFQRVFEEAMQLLEGDRFTPIRAAGPEGDHKADGVLDKGRVVFQVYSPNEIGAAKTRSKVAKDLPGAVEHWDDVIEEWVFVYNRRVERGVSPLVVHILNDFEDEYPEVAIRLMNEGDLWNRLRDKLSPTERAEVLGPAMDGWEGAFIPESDDPSEHSKDLERSRVVILQPLDQPIDPTAVMEALEPEVPFGPAYRLVWDRALGWEEMAKKQRERVDALLERAGHQVARVAVFSQAPIPLAIQLGWVLSDRVDVNAFQYHRDRKSWRWDSEVDADDVDRAIRVEGFPDSPEDDVSDVCIRVSLSAVVSDADIEGARPDGAVTVDVSVEDPDVMWLRHPVQVRDLHGMFREVWKCIRRKFPEVERLHVFYAGPAPGALALGRSFNPRMNSPLLLYEYDRNQTPRYSYALTIRG